MGTDRHEDRVEVALALFDEQVLHRVIEDDLDAEVFDALDLGIDHIARQPVLGNAVAHHAAWEFAGIVDLDIVTDARQVVGGRQAGGAGADDQDAVTGVVAGLVEPPAIRDRLVAEVSLDRVDRDRRVELTPVAGHLAWVVADPAMDRRERIVAGQLPPRGFGFTFLDEPEPLLNVLAGRTCVVAGRQQIDIDGSAGTHRPNTSGALG
ncbi:hypothetical protein SDC9_134694 [bioreactor metagenome]|uniref:Uncharacterized protein n=1 Tax=bioreactor metagenome TaxID=1076179 RepID=A0A645DDU7_9ZZZZ